MQKMPYRRNPTIQGLPLALTLLLAACGSGDSANGGEATAARQRFEALSKSDRDALLAFLKSL
jgi:hypothetical protein